MKLIIEDDEGRKTVVPFAREEITIGRQEGNTIRLTERNVSRRHAKFSRQNGHVVVEDLGSYNGIRINGERISGKKTVNDGDLIQIGDYDLAIQNEAVTQVMPTNGASGPRVASALAASPHLPGHAPIHAPAAANDALTEAATPLPDMLPGEAYDPRRQATAVIRIDQVEGAPRRPVATLDPSHAPRLTVLNTDFAGREFTLTKSEVRIGRTDDNDVAIDHRSLSRLHAKIILEDSGEWRILDMDSANGVQVNSDRYAQVTLRSNDLIELGHVKLRFLGAGDNARAVSVTKSNPGPGSAVGMRAKLIFGGGVLALALAVALAVWVGSSKSPPANLDATPIGMPEPPRPADLDGLLKAAQTQFEKGKFDAVEELLEPVKNADGTRAQKIEDLLKMAADERKNGERIAEAKRAIAAGKLELADQLLNEAENTTAFVADWDELRTKVDKLRGVPSSSKPRPDEAAKYLAEGKQLLTKKDYREAYVALTKCVELDRANPDCHAYLGSTLSRLKEPEKGVLHYREFVRLAPDDARAPQVRKLIHDYEETNAPKK